MLLSLMSAASGLVLHAPTRFSTLCDSRMRPDMALVDDFAISRVVKDVRIFDGDYAADIRDEVTAVALQSIADKGSFSLCVPGGSVVAALGGFENTDAFDFDKMHVFFANEKIPSFPCLEGAEHVPKKNI